MSRKVLIVTVVLGLLVTTLAAPATAVPLGADDVVRVQRGASVRFSDGRSVSPLPTGLEAAALARIGAAGTGGAGNRPNGDCETGGAGGCPVQS
jgi:hypothetical protein